MGKGMGHGQRGAEQQGREMGLSDRCGFSRWMGSRWAVSSREGGALGKGSEERGRLFQEEVCNCPSRIAASDLGCGDGTLVNDRVQQR